MNKFAYSILSNDLLNRHLNGGIKLHNANEASNIFFIFKGILLNYRFNFNV